ncbi:MAG TPA: hypothetical protein PLI97_04040 [Fluviicola sp.]|nr:hypothetical protein [Fluviicola sp.]
MKYILTITCACLISSYFSQDITTKQAESVIDTTAKTKIQLVYKSNQVGCNLPVSITIGSRTFFPTDFEFMVDDVPVGKQYYRIEGRVECVGIGGCAVSGSGAIDVKENHIYYLKWEMDENNHAKAWITENKKEKKSKSRPIKV